MPDSILDLLVKEGFIVFPTEDDNLIDAERAFFGYRAIHWIREKAREDKDFNLHSYLVALTYYKLGLADLKIEDNELLYRYRGAATGGSQDESLQSVSGDDQPFHKPYENINSDGTINRPFVGREPTEGDE